MCITAHTLNRKHQITVKSTCHTRTVGLQYETYHISVFRHLKFGVDS